MDQHATNWTRVRPEISGTSLDPAGIRSAFNQSGALRSFLERAAATHERPLLLLNDGHRATPTAPILRALAAWIADNAFAQSIQFNVLFATGTHRFDAPTRVAFERRTLADVGLNIGVVSWHNADDAPSLAPLHSAPGGPHFHWSIGEHRFLLPIGSAEPHYFAGITGAHKTTTIGVISRADIERNHAGALDPRSDALRLVGNPVFDGIADMLATICADDRKILAINAVGVAGHIAAIDIGQPLESAHRLAPVVARIFCHAVDAPVDLLELHVPPPLGDTFYQADKALKNNHRAVRDRGAILLIADCVNGVGSDAFLDLLRGATTYASACARVANNGYRLGDHKAVKLRRLTDPAERGVRVALISGGIADSHANLLGIRIFADRETALREFVHASTIPKTALRVEDAANVCVIPEDPTEQTVIGDA